MTLTGHRTFQYVGILLVLAMIAAGYWYFAVRAGVKTNTGATQPQGTNDLSAGLVAYWKLDEGSGTSATDSSTNAITALTLTNGPTWAAGQVGSGVDFDGSNDYATTPDNSLLEFSDTEDFTISGWFNRDTFTTDDSIIFKRNGVFSTNSGYSVYIDDATDQLIFGVSDNADPYSVTSTTTFTTAGWHHFVAVWDQDSASGTELYIDGVAQGTDSGTIGSIGAIDGTQAVVIGAESDTDNPFDGKLDEIRIYDRALSAEEAVNLYGLTAPTGVDTGLDGYWSFNSDALSGTTAYDRSGAGNTGTLANGPAITEGRVGQALSFDGSDDYVDGVGYQSTTFSAAAWIQTSGTVSDYKGIIEYSDSSNRRFGIGLDQTGDPVLVYLNASSQNRRREATGINSDDGRWHYFVGTFDGTTPMMYVDGVAVTLGSEINDLSAPNASSDFRIGCHTTTTCFNFSGKIDEARIYSRALSAAEIKAQYDAGNPDKANSSASQAQGTGNLDSGLVGYWKLDETTGSSAADASSAGNSGTLTNMENGDWVAGKYGNGLAFDGTNEYVDLGTPAALTVGPGAFTVSAWAALPNGHVAGGSVEYCILTKDNNSSGGTSYRLSLRTPTASTTVGRIFTWDGATADFIETSEFANDGTLHLITGTWDGLTKRVYLDGVLVATSAVGAQAGTAAVNVGRMSDNSCYFLGTIDEPRVYNRALSDDEVAQLYRLTTPTSVDTSLKGYWSFNGQDMSGTTAYDRSGAGNNGTLTNGPAITEGRVGQALGFDGSNDYVSTGNPSSLQLSTGTASAWVKTASPGSTHRVILSKEDAYGLLFYNDILVAYDWNVGTERSTGVDITDGNWHHIAQTFQSGVAGGTTVYVDGVAVLSTTITVSGQTKPFQIGNSDGETQYLNGSVDEVRVYNRILSAAEVQAMYDAGAPDKANTSAGQKQGTGNLDSGLAGYWKLDETTGSSASDSSTNGNIGTLTNMENGDWTTGQIGNGLTFDGTNEYVNLGSSAVYDLDTAHTVSAWVKTNASNTSQDIFTSGTNGCCGTETYLNITYNSGGGTYRFRFGNYGYPAAESSADIQTGVWYHVVGTWDGQSVRKIYVNGTLSGSSSVSAVSGELNNDAFIGWNGAQSTYFNGQIDEVRVYQRSLSADEVGQLYRLGTPTGTDTGLKGYWSFNGQDLSGTTAYDRSGAGNTGTLTNGPTVTEGKIGQALSFDGSNDYVTMGDVNALDGVTAMTALAWVKTTSFSTERQIIAKSGCVGGTNGGVFELFGPVSNGEPQFAIYKNGGSPDYYIAPSSVRVDDGNWHLVAGTYDGSTVRIYVDGVQTGSTSAPGVTLPSTSSTVYIGRCDSGAYWNGSIDEARLYNRALSVSEIKALYSSGR